MAITHFEDFTSGQVIELGSVTLTEEAIIDFATQFDPQPFHIDPVAAVDSSFGDLITSGWHTGSLWMRLYANTVLAGADSRGSPGIEQLRWWAPVRPGDTLTGTITVMDTAPSSKDPMRGTVLIDGAMTNQDGIAVMSMRSRGLFGRRTS